MEQTTIALRRYASQRIVPQAAGGPGEVVRQLGAVQAQDYLGALWALGARTPDTTEAQVEQAIAAKELVRTWPMRGTIHLVPPADVRWMLKLLTPRVAQRTQARHRQLGLDATALAAAEGVLVAILAGGRAVPRPALFEQLEAAGIATAGQRGYHILVHHAQAGLICFGPRAGKQPTFVLLDEWLPPAPEPSREEALAALALRYFTGHGPASLSDYVWWSGLTVADAKAGLAASAGRLARAECAGQSYYFADAEGTGDEGQVFLLPPFDEYLIGYRDRGASLDAAHSHMVSPGANGIFHPIVVHGGRVVGTWRRTLKAERVVIGFSPFAPWGASLWPMVETAAARYARFLGLPVSFEEGTTHRSAGP